MMPLFVVMVLHMKIGQAYILAFSSGSWTGYVHTHEVDDGYEHVYG
jgi:hypothetical protein